MQELGPSGRKEGPLGVRLKEILGPKSSFLSSFPGHHEVNGPPLPCTPAMMYWTTTGSKQQGQVTMARTFEI